MLLRKIWTSAALPIPIEDVKLDLRVDSNDENETIERMIRAAGDFIERRTGYVINAGTYEILFGGWDCAFERPLEVQRTPFRQLDSVSYLESRDVWADASVDDFQISNRGNSFVIAALSTFVAPTLFSGLDSVRIRFDAGFDPVDGDSSLSGEDAHPIEAGVRHLLLGAVGHFYKNRELFDADKIAQIELTGGSLLGTYRRFW